MLLLLEAQHSNAFGKTLNNFFYLYQCQKVMFGMLNIFVGVHLDKSTLRHDDGARLESTVLQ